jgi:hypothetical protein
MKSREERLGAGDHRLPGVGGGVLDRLVELDLSHSLQRRRGTDRQGAVCQARAEDYWTLRERFEQGELDIDPDDDKLAAQLGSIK